MSKIEGLAKEIAAALAAYSSEVAEGLEVAKQQAANNAAKILKVTSPKNTGAYAKGWTVSKEGTRLIVHNRTNYQLTHLLEKGHAKVNVGRVAAKVHIKPAEDQAVEEYISGVERMIRK